MSSRRHGRRSVSTEMALRSCTAARGPLRDRPQKCPPDIRSPSSPSCSAPGTGKVPCWLCGGGGTCGTWAKGKSTEASQMCDSIRKRQNIGRWVKGLSGRPRVHLRPRTPNSSLFPFESHTGGIWSPGSSKPLPLTLLKAGTTGWRALIHLEIFLLFFTKTNFSS